MHDELLTIEQAAKFFGVSPRTLRRWEQNGALKPMRTIGNQRRYSKSDLSSVLRKPSVAPQQPVPPAPAPQPATSYIQKPELPKQRKVNSLTASLFGGATLGLWAIGILTLVLVSFPSFAGTFQGMNDRLNGRFVESNGNRQVLASTDKTSDFVLKFNAPAIFGKKVAFLDSFEIKNSLKVDKQSNLFGGINTNNSDINAGTGRLTASNVIYSLLAGSNVSITGDPQNPTVNAITSGVTTFQGQTGALTLTNGDGIGLNGLQVTNTGVLSLQGQSGAMTLNGDSGISVSGTSISNTDRGSSQNIFKVITAGGTDISAGSNNDQLTFAAGSGISITGDAGSKTVTITGSSTGLAGLTTNGVLYATSPTTATSTDVGTNGYILKSNGPGLAPNWVAPGTVLGNVQFDFIDSGTNTTAAMVVGSGASLGFTGSGTINASTLGGATFTAPGAIGSTTAGSGAFTTITGSSFNGLAVTNTGSNTLTIATGKTLAVNNSLTLAGTDGTSFTFPATSGTLVTTDATQTLTNKTIAAGSNTIIGLTNSNLSGSAGITNANLANASLTVTAGTGLSGGGVVSLGGSVSLNNAGVTGASAGTGISIDQATGNITITNNGVTSAIAGAGIGLDAGTGAVTISNNGVTSLTGTSNRVSVSGSTGAITLNLPQDIHTGANPTFAGLTLSSVTTNGGLLYTNGSGTVAQTSAGNVGECLTSNGGGTPTWSTCAAGSNMWQSNNGTVSPFSDTLDLLVGGTSTSSAKFAFINNTGGGTPTASISAGFFGSTYLTAYGELQTTSNNSLILGGNTTGNVLIPLSTDDRVGVGTNTPQARLHVYGDTRMGGDNDYVTVTGFGDLSFTGGGDYLVGADDYAFRFSGDEDYGMFFNATNTRYEFRDGNAARVFSVDANNGNMYSPGTLTGISGLTSSGTINFTGLTTNGGVLYTNGSGTVAQTSVGSLGECLTSNGGGAPTWSTCAAGSNLWQVNNGAVSPFSDTLDLLIGGTSTASAKFAFINNTGSGTPTASISGAANNATTLTATGILGTTNAQTLQLGSASTGSVQLLPGGTAVLTALTNGNVGIGTTTPNERLTVNGNIVGNADNSFLSIDDSNLNRFGITKKAGFTPMLTHGSGTNFVISRSSGTTINAVNTFTNEFLIDTSGNVGINTDTPTARLDVNGAASVSGSLSFQTGAGSIQTTANNTLTLGGSTTGDISFMPGNSSSSLYLSSNGNVGIGTTLPDEKLDVLGNFQIKDAETQTKAYRFRTNGGALDLEGAGAALYLSNWSGVDFTGTQRNYLQVEDNVHEAHAEGKWMFKDGNTGLAGNELLTIDGPGTADVVINESGTNATDLRVEGDTDANLLFTQASTDRIGIGTNTPLAKLDVRGNSGTTPIASFTGSTAKAAIVVDQSGAGDLFTASASGTSRFTIANNGNIVGSGTLTGLTGLASSGTINLTSFTNNGGLLYTNGSGAVAQTSIGSLGQCLTSAGGGAPTWSSCAATNYWQLNSGTISPFSDTLDLLVGGTSTASAKFAFINNSGSGTPTASISAGTAGATYLTATGNIQTTANQTLSLGGSTTGNILLNSDNNNFVGIGHANPTSSLDVNGGITTRGSNSSLTMYSQDGGGNYYTLYSSAGELAFYNGAIRGALTSTGRLGLGFNNNVPQAQLDVQADTFSLPGGYIHGSTGKATLVLNQTSGAGDLFTASRSGVSKFTIMNNGDVQINNLTTAGGLLYTNGSGTVAQLGAGNLGQCLLSNGSGNAPSYGACAAGTNYWQSVNPGTIAAYNETVDLLVGGTATSSAKFSVLGIAAGTNPTASVSATTGGNQGNGISLAGDGSIQSLRNNTLTLGGNTTGNIALTPLNGNGAIALNGNTAIAANKNLALASGTGQYSQTFTGTTTDAMTITGNALTSGRALFISSSNNATVPSALMEVDYSGLQAAASLVRVENSGVGNATALLDVVNSGVSTPGSLIQLNNSSLGTPTNALTITGNASGTIGTAINIATTTVGTDIRLQNGETIDNNNDNQINLNLGSTGTLLLTNGTNLTTTLTTFNLINTAATTLNLGGAATDLNIGAATGSTGINNSLTVGTSTANPLATLDVRGNSSTLPIASFSGATNFAASLVDQSGNGDIFTASKSGATKFVVKNNGNVGIGTDQPTEKLSVEGGNISIGQQTNTGQSAEQSWTKVSQSTAGTIASSGTTNIASVSASAVYNGSLYVGTTESNSAEVYRYNGTGGSWTKVSQSTAGTIASGGTASIDGITAMTVYNGYLYAGTTEPTDGEIYRYDGGTTWTKVSAATAGTIDTGGTASIDGVVSMAVNNGRLYAGTQKTAGAEIYEYAGAVGDWIQVEGNTGNCALGGTAINDSFDVMTSYNGRLWIAGHRGGARLMICTYVQRFETDPFTETPGTIYDSYTDSDITGLTQATAMVVYNGKLYVSVRKQTGSADLFEIQETTFDIPNDSATRVINSAGSVDGSTTGQLSVSALTVYNGSLYVGTEKLNSAEIYRYEGGLSSGSRWTKVSQSTAGTIASGGTSSVDMIAQMFSYGGNLFATTFDTGTNGAEVYNYNVVSNQSYALKFHAGLTQAGGEQNSLLNEGSISFIASSSANVNNGTNNTGSFLFSHGVLTQAGAYDIAEDYATRDDSLEPGDLVAIEPGEQEMVKKASGSAATVVGIYSEKPGFRLSQADTTINGGRAVPIALAGRVPLKVSTKNGPIKPGDMLTASDIPGVAMKAIQAGPIVGRSLGFYDNDDPQTVGKVMTFINLSWFDPGVTLAANGNITVDGKLLSTESLQLALDTVKSHTDNKVADLEATSSAKFAELDIKAASQSAQITRMSDRIASLEAKLTASDFTLPSLYQQASSAAELNLDKADLKDVTVSKTLSVLGRTTLSDVGITGRMTVGLLSINGLDDEGYAVINTSAGPLKLQSDGINGIDLLNGKLTIDNKGNLVSKAEITAKKVNIDTKEVASASLGQGTMEAGKSKVTIETTAVTDTSRIFVTARTKTNQPLSVTTQQDGESFTVEVDGASSKDVKFDWWIVN